MAAYAALVSLMNIMDQIQDHPYHSTSLDTHQIASLGKKLDFLLDFIETDSHGVLSKEAQVVESQIAFAAYAAEDVIESHVVDQIQGGLFPLLDLRTVIQDMDSVKEKVVELIKEEISGSERITYSTPAATLSRSPTRNKKDMVGVLDDEQLIQLLHRLTAQPSNRQFIPLIGMGGIGKTTLAKTAYEHSLIVQHFDIRTWVTVSQTYNAREILLQLVSGQTSEIDNETDEQLGERLHKKLWGRRYFLVVDDIWSIEAWDKVKRFLPDNDNRSRIVVTTRISNVAIHFDSMCLRLSFLDDDRSWNLFCEKAFGRACCVPRELEDIGKQIVAKCQGLPLSIVVIGGLLGKSPRMLEYWRYVAKDLISILNSGVGDDCLNVLSLSYTYLPPHLKPCFLYMGIFPEDHEIRVSQLIKLWVAEGFMKPNKVQSSEEIGRGYLNDLIDRNLLLEHSLGSNGQVTTCKIHDLLRDVCLKVGRDDGFMRTTKDVSLDVDTTMTRRIAFNEMILEPEYYYHQVFPALQSASLIRTLVTSTDRWTPVPPVNNKILLRVFNLVEIGLSENIFDQLNLRYLAFEYSSLMSNRFASLPLSISLLWNMQTLIIEGEVHAPSEIWEMRQLRHLDIDLLYLPDPPPSGDHIVLRNLQTLKRAVNFTWSEEVCKRIPNVKKLNMRYDVYGEGSNDYCFYNLCSLHKLESLRWSNALPDHLLHNLASPSSLKKLTLENCIFFWEDLTMIGSLPCLEVFKLKTNVSEAGPLWNPVEGEFRRLKFLLIQGSNLVYWAAESYHFPVLESLVLVKMDHLDEIPLGIGEIPTLGAISLYCCSESAAISALRIAEEINEGLRVRVQFVDKAQVESFWEKAEQSAGFMSSNFQVETIFSGSSTDQE